ncbi:Anaphase-promoting complex subunit 23 [Orbilia oligospora]|uniref:Anaphase-promoting complex subunit 23 n=1 Tax=Orbilia oligospora TaxID=2813651 RepID=A0A7C8UNM7_ORBOL|nr:Anaphase-promoting complex subunit 23 [Orbilia oligospora]KAF3222668.1 Anaphase-promoting complex subunit 23 [Orbilia oligospora]
MASPAAPEIGKHDLMILRKELRIAAIRSSDRCLFHAAKWLAEQLNSLPQNVPSSHHYLKVQPSLPHDGAGLDTFVNDDEEDKYHLAKSYFNVNEFDRAARVVEGCVSSKAAFLCLYSKFMAGEKRKDEESEMVLGPLDGNVTANKELPILTKKLETMLADNKEDTFLLYLYGVVLLKQRNEKPAYQALVRSVVSYPYNWAAWDELKTITRSIEDVNRAMLDLPTHLMTSFFQLLASQELYHVNEGVYTLVEQLTDVFPRSSWLKSQRALLSYHVKDYEESEKIFDEIMQNDPYRLDFLDHYSNILYVMDKRSKLAFVAQVASATDKFRPETCCVIGNYFSMRSEHEKSIMYFRRALNLDRNFLSAWTLLGHEFVELKNTHAAIESYRRAIDVNRKDYRAWYGLGQAYEVLEMNYYALYYYQRAGALRPYDSQMWAAMAACYEKMNRPDDAIKSYKRALSGNAGTSAATANQWDGFELNTKTLIKIAKLYERVKRSDEAVHYMEMCLKAEPDLGPSEDIATAKSWLAHYEKEKLNLGRALQLAQELFDAGLMVEDSRAMVRDIRNQLDMDHPRI